MVGGEDEEPVVGVVAERLSECGHGRTVPDDYSGGRGRVGEPGGDVRRAGEWFVGAAALRPEPEAGSAGPALRRRQFLAQGVVGVDVERGRVAALDEGHVDLEAVGEAFEVGEEAAIAVTRFDVACHQHPAAGNQQ